MEAWTMYNMPSHKLYGYWHPAER